MEINIKTIGLDSKFLPLVKKLGDENNKTLGFFPSGAFDECAHSKRILVAVNENGELLGYLLFRTTKSRVVIVHLCVDEKYRGINIANNL